MLSRESIDVLKNVFRKQVYVPHEMLVEEEALTSLVTQLDGRVANDQSPQAFARHRLDCLFPTTRIICTSHTRHLPLALSPSNRRNLDPEHKVYLYGS